MGFFIKKSKNLGNGFKLNLSKSGLGISAGFKGFRISKNSEGVFLNSGAKGLYFRKKLDSKKENITDENISDYSIIKFVKAIGLGLLIVFILGFINAISNMQF